ncbi:MAG: 16S rRNA (adenine(1518)-N(6)/adenine(1519)-N(6))-dimethyltransferase RsmA [Alphaproteobacteria bacterium]|nr:16S rRNA (adenine(1518)-N(6)/adenine(1519)-N(6))-dimethyltransferase RsmA [Alphaproteobacteria bacterium]
MSFDDGLPPLREVIAQLGLSARKALGQNFLFDLNLTRRIAREGLLDGVTVVEIGPGPGGLTRALLAEGAGRVVAIERDERCLPALEAIARAYPGRLSVVRADALTVDERDLVGPGERAVVVANLPYNVATPLLVRWLTAGSWPPWYERLTLMFQREVAERIVAAPRTPAYGRLSIISQWRTAPRILFDVHRSAFTPSPNVTSTIVRFDILKQPRGAADVAMLERVTAAGFGQRRKMLRSSLKSLGTFSDELIAEAGLEPTARAEEISVEGFAALAHRLEVHLRKHP